MSHVAVHRFLVVSLTCLAAVKSSHLQVVALGNYQLRTVTRQHEGRIYGSVRSHGTIVLIH